MSGFELVALDTTTPQLKAVGGADTYAAPASIIMANGSLGYWFNAADGYGMKQDSGNGLVKFYANGGTQMMIDGVANGVRCGNLILMGPNTGSADVGLKRTAAKVLQITDGSAGSGCLQLPTFTVANLPAAATAGAGARASVSDATQTFASANFGTTVTGGGANFVPVVSDGANWKIG